MFLLVVFLRPVVPVAGQDQARGSLIIGTPNFEAFPDIQFSLEAYDSQGAFLSDLKIDDLQIKEGSETLSASQITTAPNGLQLTVALNTHPSMNSAASGSQYTEIQAALLDWVRQYPAPRLDDFSLSTPTGLFLIRSTDPAQWEKALVDYQPDINKAQPSLVSLADALDLATDPLGREEMKRAILFITPTLPPALLSTLPDYTSRARQIGVRVYVWLVAPSDTAEVAPALKDLALQSGGQFNLLSPAAARPNIESQLANIRTRYEVVYTSKIKDSGRQPLSVQIERDGQVLASNERSLTLTVLPPNPIFLSPPPQIQVQMAPAANGSTELTLTPEEIQLKILVEFPDKHTRDLKATRLFVNDQLAAENLQPPFDQFTWRLAEVSDSGQLMLRVEAQDVLDISGSSLEIPVEVTVEKLAVTAAAAAGINSDHLWVVVGSVAAAGSALAVVLLISGRKNKINWRRVAAERSRAKDPITQPVPGQGSLGYQRKKGDTPTNPHSAASPSKSKPRVTGPLTPAVARLVGLTENEQPIAGGVIPLSDEECTFGSDPERAAQVLASPTVDGLHARIFCNAAGEYYLADQNTVAGTWINYAPVNGHGVRLEDGDLVHIGRVTFRFEQLTSGRSPRAIQVIAPPSQPKN